MMKANSQTNLYLHNKGTQPLFLRNNVGFTECGDQVFYISEHRDTNSIQQAIRTFYLNAVNKFNPAFNKSLQIAHDTVFNRFDEYLSTNIIPVMGINPVTKQMSIVFTSDVDSSSHLESPDAFYPRKISLMQIDTNLNIIRGRKPILFNEQGTSRYTIAGAGGILHMEAKRIIVSYGVRDTNVSAGGVLSVAEKYLILDDTGKILANEFLGWEPTGTGPLFPWHTGVIMSTYQGDYAARVAFDDSIGNRAFFTLFWLDSNLKLTDTFDSPAWYHNIRSTTDKHTNVLGYGAENDFFLPTGSLIRSNGGRYSDRSIKKDYFFYSIAKGGRSAGYRPELIYFPDPIDSGDYTHSQRGYFPSAYNNFDNSIYYFCATNAMDVNFCLNGAPNLGKIVALDTNLQEKWIRYIRPRPGRCVISTSVGSPDGRGGVLISGYESSVADTKDQSQWQPFIYHIDSSTKLGIDNPESLLIITEQFSLYPNPAATTVTIENVLGTDFSYSMINMVGQMVMSGHGQGANTPIDIASLRSGIYLVRLKTVNGNAVSLKFVRE